MLLNDLERLRNTLLAARQAVLLASADAGEGGRIPPVDPLWLAGYEAALVTVAVAFGLEVPAMGSVVLQRNTIGLSSNAVKELNPRSHPKS